MSTTFRRDIEGLRALSVGLVMAYHAGVTQLAGGYVGVDVFFVLSGYLITGLLVRELEQTGTISLMSFYAKRARRLLPASFTVLAFVSAVVFIVPRWFPSVIIPQLYGRSISWDIQRSALYIVNWLFAERSVSYQGSGEVGSPVLHFWSLAVEEQFYAVWPVLLLAVALVAKRSRAALAAVITAVTIASFAWSIRMSIVSPNEAYFVTTTRVWEMSLGGIGALIAPHVARRAWVAKVRPVVSTAAVIAIVAAAAIFDAETVYPGYAALLPTIAALALVLIGVHGPLRAFFEARPMQWIGARSYSLYLWHWPALWLATSLIGPLTVRDSLLVMALAFAPAAASFRFIETPVRVGFGSRVSVFSTIVAAAAVSAAGFALGALLLTTTTGSVRLASEPEPVTQVAGIQLVAGTLQPDAGSVRYDVPAGYSNGCFITLNSDAYNECSVGREDAPTTVVVFGNSHAAHWAPSLDAIAERQDWKLIYLVHDGCRISRVQEQSTECEIWLDRAWKRLPELVAEQDVSLVLTSPPPPPVELSARDTELFYESAFTSLNALNVPVVMIVPPPRGKLVGVDCPTPAAASLATCATDRSQAVAANYSALTVVAGRTGVRSIDLTDYFCDETLCPAIIDDLWVQRDGAHLTRVFALALANALESELMTTVPELS